MPMNYNDPTKINNKGNSRALSRDVWTGEVYTLFETEAKLRSLIDVRHISHGIGIRIDSVGRTTADYHTPGTQILGKNINHATQNISIDALLKTDVFIDNLQENLAMYEVRSRYTQQMGLALGKSYDRCLFAELVKAARGNAFLTEGTGGTQILNDHFKVDAVAGSADRVEQAKYLAEALFMAAQVLDEKDIPDTMERYVFFRPNEYYALAQNTDLINRLWGGSGAYSDGTIFKVAGINILMSNHLPKLNATKQTYDPKGGTAYIPNPEYNLYHNADFGKTIGVVFCKDAISSVELLGMSTDIEYMADYQGTLIVSKLAMGCGMVRPELSVELALETLTNTKSTYV